MPSPAGEQGINISLDKRDDRCEGIIVGRAVDGERTAYEIAVAVGKIELIGRSHIITLDMVEVAVFALFGNVYLPLIHPGGLGDMALDKEQRVGDAGIQVGPENKAAVNSGIQSGKDNIRPQDVILPPIGLNRHETRVIGHKERGGIGKRIETVITFNR